MSATCETVPQIPVSNSTRSILHLIDVAWRCARYEQAHERTYEFYFTLNGVKVRARAESSPQYLHLAWRQAHWDKSIVEVGPFVRANPILIRNNEDVPREELGIIHMAEHKLDATPRLAVTSGWEEEVDQSLISSPEASTVITFAEHWGRLMQFEMFQGSLPRELSPSIARDAFNEACLLSAYSYAAPVAKQVLKEEARQLLSEYWHHNQSMKRIIF